LAYDKIRGGRLVKRVSEWYERATQHTLDLPDEADRYSIVLSPSNAPLVRVNVVDTGEGMTQVLPVLVLLAQAAEGVLGPSPVLAIEHPELHLHPNAERELSKLLCTSVASSVATGGGRVRTILETHSHHVLLSVQLAIVHGDISPDDVLVYWVRELDDGQSSLDAVKFDELARPIDAKWPPGVFSEELEQARALALERMRRAHP